MPPDVSQAEFRLATPADAELLLDLMRGYYAFDGHHYDRDLARVALLGLLQHSAYGLAWLVLDSNKLVTLCFVLATVWNIWGVTRFSMSST